MIKLCPVCSTLFKPQAPRVRRCRPCVAKSKTRLPPTPSQNRSRAMLAYHQVKRDLALEGK